MRVRIKRHIRRPPDLTSLFDVLFIVVFVALIRAAAAQQTIAQLTAPPPPQPPKPAPPPPAIAELRTKALANLNADLSERTPLVIRVTERGTIEALEAGDKKIALDVPLVEHSPDENVEVAYLGDRSAELRICRIAAVHLGIPDLSRHLVIIVPTIPLADVRQTEGSRALLRGLDRDVVRCFVEQHGIAAIVDPSELAPSNPKPP